MDDSLTSYENAKRSGRFPWGNSERHYTTTIFFTTAGEAEQAYTAMRNIVNRFGYLTEADVAELTDRIAHYTDDYYGWTRKSFSLRRKRKQEKPLDT